MSPNPIHRVLSTFQKHGVRALLIGGQACIVYGAAEFSRDSDFVVLVTAENLRRLRRALAELRAEQVFFPPLEARFLRRGHACHFRCQAEDVRGLRVDVMARLRGCDHFASLWRRRTKIRLPGGLEVPVIGLRDLVRCKKTQRDRDWYMLRRLVENDVRQHRDRPARGQVQWWLLECRTVETLMSLTGEFAVPARRLRRRRPLLEFALVGEEASLTGALGGEEQQEREQDRAYWRPLRAEIERMRRARPRRAR